MYTALNITQAILYAIAAIAFWFIGYKFYKAGDVGTKLFGIGLIAMGIVEFCALGVTMLWQFFSINFKSLEYLVYIFAIILFFASAAGSLKPKTRKLSWAFLIIISILVAGLYLINPTLSGPGVYSARYVLSFDNPTTVNVFALVVALSFGLATLIISSKLVDKTVKTIVEAGLLVVIIGLVLNILSYSDTTKLIANIAAELALIVIFITCLLSKIKLKKSSS
jgi:hypothetical protein